MIARLRDGPMSNPRSDDFLRIGPKVRVLPIIHGAGDYAVQVRDELLARPYDCLAVPLPPSFQDLIEDAVLRLPLISAVVQQNADDVDGCSYVPIDPCQGVIAGLRTARGEHIAREFIDLETPHFEPNAGVFPDPYALKRVSPAGFAAALLPYIPRPEAEQHRERIAWMARRLHELEERYETILFVCSLLDWPWVREAYLAGTEPAEPGGFFTPTQSSLVDPRTLTFLLGELPFVTGLYERGRFELTPDDNLSVDGVKELVLETRDQMKSSLPRVAQRLTPQLLSLYFRYVRNLALIERRLTPDLYTLVVAAQQMAGDDF